MTDIFETATRNKIRFQTAKGELSVEQLWDLPLTARHASHLDLDTVARSVAHELRELAEESFVQTKENPAKAQLELKLEIAKHIIGVRLAEAEAAKTRAARAEEREKLMNILGRKQDEALEALTPEEIRARLDALK